MTDDINGQFLKRLSFGCESCFSHSSTYPFTSELNGEDSICSIAASPNLYESWLCTVSYITTSIILSVQKIDEVMFHANGLVD